MKFGNCTANYARAFLLREANKLHSELSMFINAVGGYIERYTDGSRLFLEFKEKYGYTTNFSMSQKAIRDTFLSLLTKQHSDYLLQRRESPYMNMNIYTLFHYVEYLKHIRNTYRQSVGDVKRYASGLKLCEAIKSAYSRYSEQESKNNYFFNRKYVFSRPSTDQEVEKRVMREFYRFHPELQGVDVSKLPKEKKKFIQEIYYKLNSDSFLTTTKAENLVQSVIDAQTSISTGKFVDLKRNKGESTDSYMQRIAKHKKLLERIAKEQTLAQEYVSEIISRDKSYLGVKFDVEFSLYPGTSGTIKKGDKKYGPKVYHTVNEKMVDIKEVLSESDYAEYINDKKKKKGKKWFSQHPLKPSEHQKKQYELERRREEEKKYQNEINNNLIKYFGVPEDSEMIIDSNKVAWEKYRDKK